MHVKPDDRKTEFGRMVFFTYHCLVETTTFVELLIPPQAIIRNYGSYGSDTHLNATMRRGIHSGDANVLIDLGAQCTCIYSEFFIRLAPHQFEASREDLCEVIKRITASMPTITVKSGLAAGDKFARMVQL